MVEDNSCGGDGDLLLGVGAWGVGRGKAWRYVQGNRSDPRQAVDEGT